MTKPPRYLPTQPSLNTHFLLSRDSTPKIILTSVVQPPLGPRTALHAVTVTPCRQSLSPCCHTVQTAFVTVLSHRADSLRHCAVTPCRQPSSLCCHTVQTAFVTVLSHRSDSPCHSAVTPCTVLVTVLSHRADSPCHSAVTQCRQSFSQCRHTVQTAFVTVPSHRADSP